MGGTDTIRGIAFQLAQTLSDVLDFLVAGDAVAVVVEGAQDVVDYEFLGGDGQRVAVRQAKTRREPGTWGASELAKILCSWGDLADAADADFAFVTDASLNQSGQKLLDLIRAMRDKPDEGFLRQSAQALVKGGLRLPALDVVRRIQILTRMGDADRILAVAESRVLSLLSRGRLATLDDATNAVNALYRHMFVVGGSVELSRRTISRPQVLAALGIDDRWLAGGLSWSTAVAEKYRSVMAEPGRRAHGFVPLGLKSVAATPLVLRLLGPSAASDASVNAVVRCEILLDQRRAVLVGATGQGKTSTLIHLSAVAAEMGRFPVVLNAAGHVSGALPRRIKQEVEVRLGQILTAGALDSILLDPALMLFIDGVSEVDDDTREALREDLGRITAQRNLRIIATGRDLNLTIATTAAGQQPEAYRLADLDGAARRQLAKANGCSDQTVGLIEDRLGDAAGNPMLFLMALSVSAEGVPETRAAVYDQFMRGIAFRAGRNHDDVRIDALGAAWATSIGRGQRTADHYMWRVALANTLERVGQVPSGCGAVDPLDALDFIQSTGLLVRLDPDSGLAPMHDSVADYLAARAIHRKQADLPVVFGEGYDETLLFLVEMSGLSNEVAIRLAQESPLLAVRIASLRHSCGEAHPEIVSRILTALTDECSGLQASELVSAAFRLCTSRRFTGVVFAGVGRGTVDEATFTALAVDHPALVMPPNTGSLQLAIRLWSEVIRRKHQPAHRVFQPAPPADPPVAVELLTAYLSELAAERHRLVTTTLPYCIREKVLIAMGPAGMVAYIGDREPGWLGGVELPVLYRPASEIHVERSGRWPAAGLDEFGTGYLSRIMREHPTIQAARDIAGVLNALTDNHWPES
ncbi:hypothetical protein [Paractinoplanes hotanensis]|uniref:AAA+ ATPase domain-containing protein n=1 Tax=Paractinoplanes hotanensis TaxID=2906497 RepID=A0ABT0Y3K2_9ACTN|nr:hypothetical protein [Actinoplanes hotanensis]MCM4080623.1 hypothetical protein [Actinoplanes hotanensis]